MPNRMLIRGNKYRFGYQGQFAEYDPETGYNHFEARLLDTRIGRWLATDPASAGFSPYWSMNNNPISFYDPTGEVGRKEGSENLYFDKGDGPGELMLYINNHGGDITFEQASNLFYSNMQDRYGAISEDHSGHYLTYQEVANVDEHFALMHLNTYVSAIHTGQKNFAQETWNNPGFQMVISLIPVSKVIQAGGWAVKGGNLLKTTSKFKSVFKNADDLISTAGKLKRGKSGLIGIVKGNADKTFKTLTKNATKLESGVYRLKDGTFVNIHKSKHTGLSTISVKKGGKMYKIRFDK